MNGAAASYGDLLVTSLVVLVGVCIAAFVVVRVLGRFLATGRARGAHLLDVVARVPLEPRRSLYVVDVAGKSLLVGTSEMGLSVLTELDAGVVRARMVERPTFGELVRDAWTRRRERRAAASPTASGASTTAPAAGDLTVAPTVDLAAATAPAEPAAAAPAATAAEAAGTAAEPTAATAVDPTTAARTPPGAVGAITATPAGGEPGGVP